MPLLPASCYCLLCQCVEQTFPQLLQFQTRSLANPTLLKHGLCHPDLITQRFTQAAEVSGMALSLLCAVPAQPDRSCAFQNIWQVPGAFQGRPVSFDSFC